MFPLIESIKLLDGELYNLKLHEERMRYSIKSLYSEILRWSLKELLLKHTIPEKGLYKCRIEYSANESNVEFIPYAYSIINSIKIIENNSIEYSFKFADRNDITLLFKQKGACDDVLIVKEGLVRDTSFANVLFKKNNQWYTPLNPLLKGVKRRELLEKGLIKEEEIGLKDVKEYESIKLVNAMRGFDSQEIDVSRIVF
ncbi:MAG TPA: hypothetical protein DIW27_07255 [Cytophagales bacterium]|mgnify:FL=1|nr:hypothetical protein [Cytophagales bacterium]